MGLEYKIQGVKKWRFIFLTAFLCTLLTLSIAATIFLLNKNSKEKFTPPEFDSSARSGFPEVPDDLGFSPLEIEPGFSVYLCGNLTLKDGNIPIYFTSPKSNKVLMKMQIYDENGKLLTETGLIRPDEYIEKIPLSDFKEKEAPIKLKIITYRPDSYVSMGTAGFNTILKSE